MEIFGSFFFNIVGILSFILTLIGVLFSFRKKTLAYNFFNVKVLNDIVHQTSQIQVMFDNICVNDLIFTKIAIWNDSKKSIFRNDLASQEELSIQLNDQNATIYKFDVLNKIQNANNFNLKIDDSSKSILCDFEYIGPNEGIVFGVFHNSFNSIPFKIKGIIKESSKSPIRLKNQEYILAGRLASKFEIFFEYFGNKKFFFEPISTIIKLPVLFCALLIALPLLIIISIISLPFYSFIKKQKRVKIFYELN